MIAGTVIGALAGFSFGRRIKAAQEAPIDGETSTVDQPQQIAAAIENIRAAVARKERYARLIDDSMAMQRAQQAVLEHLPLLPRNAKRLLNRLRLQLFVTREKGLLKPQGPVGPEEVGKWVVLQERWPVLAHATTMDIRLLGQLEDAVQRPFQPKTEEDPLAVLVKTIVPGLGQTESLRAFFTSTPHLGPLTSSLIQFEPA